MKTILIILNIYASTIFIKPYLSHVKHKIGNSRQCSTPNMNVCVHIQILKSNFNFRKLQINSATLYKELLYTELL